MRELPREAVALLSPAITLLYLVIVFGFYAILDGIVAVLAAIRARDTESPVATGRTAVTLWAVDADATDPPSTRG